MVQSSIDELWTLLHRSTDLVAKALTDVSSANLSNDPDEHRRALDRYADLLWHTMVLADLLGRRRILLEAEAVRDRNEPRDGMVQFAVTAWDVAEDTPLVPHVPFEEAISDILSRHPVLVSDELLDASGMIQGPEGLRKPTQYEMVQQIYSREHAFALARASDMKVTENIQKTLGRMMREGETVETGAGKLRRQAILDNQEGWTRAYAETVYRTNLNTAYTQGIKEFAKEDAVAEVIGGFRYSAIRGPRTRPNHRWANGLVAGTHDPLWARFTPPLGYNCRCSLSLVDRWDMEKMGLIQDGRVIPGGNQARLPNFAKAGPDPGFPGYQGG